jgi:hypothetical protein
MQSMMLEELVERLTLRGTLPARPFCSAERRRQAVVFVVQYQRTRIDRSEQVATRTGQLIPALPGW